MEGNMSKVYRLVLLVLAMLGKMNRICFGFQNSLEYFILAMGAHFTEDLLTNCL
jgi:nicotinamide riboside transporter PnuC